VRFRYRASSIHLVEGRCPGWPAMEVRGRSAASASRPARGTAFHETGRANTPKVVDARLLHQLPARPGLAWLGGRPSNTAPPVWCAGQLAGRTSGPTAAPGPCGMPLDTGQPFLMPGTSRHGAGGVRRSARGRCRGACTRPGWMHDSRLHFASTSGGGCRRIPYMFRRSRPPTSDTCPLKSGSGGRASRPSFMNRLFPNRLWMIAPGGR